MAIVLSFPFSGVSPENNLKSLNKNIIIKLLGKWRKVQCFFMENLMKNRKK